MITQQYVKEALDYNAVSGMLTWRIRPDNHFANRHATKTWNSKYAGKPAGSIDPTDGYLRVSLARKNWRAHRLIYLHQYGTLPDTVDHRNTIRTDNTLSNLRAATKSQNNQNRKHQPKKEKTHYKGVSWSSSNKKNPWRARITVNGVTRQLGSFASDLEAYQAYCSAASKLFGAFANRGITC